MKRLLITGYPGWLTGRFLETLRDYEFPYDAVRCLVLPGPAAVPARQMTTSRGSLTLEICEGDLGSAEGLERACEGVQDVFHAAGVIHVKKISEFDEINRGGTKRLLEAAAKQGVQRAVVISSNAAQGFCPGPGIRLKETDACHPHSPYARSKYEAENEARVVQKKTGLEIVILRPAMFYGPPVPPRHLDIFKKIARGWFPVFGHGNYERSVTYIDHLVQAVHLALKVPCASGQTYAITDAEIPTLNQLVDAMAEGMGLKVRRIHLPAFLAAAARSMDKVISAAGAYWMLPHIVGESTRHIAYSIEKAEKELGYKPLIGYREGYRRTMAWCREQGYDFR